jgi:hypothetical protein
MMFLLVKEIWLGHQAPQICNLLKQSLLVIYSLFFGVFEGGGNK